MMNRIRWIVVMVLFWGMYYGFYVLRLPWYWYVALPCYGISASLTAIFNYKKALEL